jgi:hypothetical protein
MRLPLSSSLPSVGSSDDGALTSQLLLAGANAEVNRFSWGEFDDSDLSASHRTTHAGLTRSINFNPKVAVRFIRSRSQTVFPSLSDISSSLRSFDSPVAADDIQALKDSLVDSDDEDFERFYRTMESSTAGITRPVNRPRRFSFESLDDLSVGASGRARSVSCDDYVFQSMKSGG